MSYCKNSLQTNQSWRTRSRGGLDNKVNGKKYWNLMHNFVYPRPASISAFVAHVLLLSMTTGAKNVSEIRNFLKSVSTILTAMAMKPSPKPFQWWRKEHPLRDNSWIFFCGRCWSLGRSLATWKRSFVEHCYQAGAQSCIWLNYDFRRGSNEQWCELH